MNFRNFKKIITKAENSENSGLLLNFFIQKIFQKSDDSFFSFFEIKHIFKKTLFYDFCVFCFSLVKIPKVEKQVF